MAVKKTAYEKAVHVDIMMLITQTFAWVARGSPPRITN